MLIDIRLSELQSNTSNSIPLTLIIGIFFCYYLFQFLPYNIAISQGGTNRFGALNFKLFNLLNEKVTVTEQAKELFVQSNFLSESSSSNVIFVASQANLFNTISLRNYQPSGLDLSISKYITHSVASPKNNNLATASSKGWDAYLVESNHIASIGNVMYTIYVLWLLQAVLILLLAMVGSIVITIKPNSSPLQVGRISNKPIKLPSNLRSYSTTAENKTLHPNWITGFSDGEASFSVSISKAKNTKTGFQVIPTFAIELHYRDIDLLYRIKEFFGVGNVYLIENKGHAVFVVGSIKDLLNVIIPHYANYSLLTIKRVNFLLFKEILELMGKKKHLTEEGLQRIVSIRAIMNKKTLIASYTSPLIKIDVPIVPDLTKKDITPEWLVGFTDAEGCFFLNVRPNISKLGFGASLMFSLTQHSRDLLLFKLIIEYLGFGILVEEKLRDVVRIRTENLQIISEHVIPFFTNYPLESSKLLNFQDFCKACDLIKEKAHLTEEGIAKIKIIKSGMNTGRKFSINIRKSNGRSHSNYNTIGSASPNAEADNKYLHYIHSRSTPPRGGEDPPLRPDLGLIKLLNPSPLRVTADELY